MGLVSVTAGLVFCLVALTAWIDPFADFNYLTGHLGKPPLSLNNFGERKYKSILIRQLPRDSFEWGLFGNSRATVIDISNGIPGFGGPGINFAFSGANLDQIREFISTVKARHPNIRPIIATNFDHCLMGESKDFLYLSPRTKRDSQRDALSRLFSLQTLAFGLQALKNPRRYSEIEMKPAGHNIRHLGYTDKAKIMARIKDDLEIYRASYTAVPYNNYCLDVMRKIKKENPSAIFIINPLSRWILDILHDAGKTKDRSLWVNSLREIGPVLDFSCAEEITDHWQNYADGHHVRGSVSKALLADIGRLLAGNSPELACRNTVSSD